MDRRDELGENSGEKGASQVGKKRVLRQRQRRTDVEKGFYRGGKTGLFLGQTKEIYDGRKGVDVKRRGNKNHDSKKGTN